MKNFVQAGTSLPVTAPYAVNSGQGVLVGALFGIAAFNAANGAPVEIKPKGIFDITAVTADTGAVGVKVYWDNTARKITTTSTNNTLVGCLAAAKGASDTTARVYLDGVVR